MGRTRTTEGLLLATLLGLGCGADSAAGTATEADEPTAGSQSSSTTTPTSGTAPTSGAGDQTDSGEDGTSGTTSASGTSSGSGSTGAQTPPDMGTAPMLPGNLGRCQSICDDVVAQECENGPEWLACMVECGLVTVLPACQDDYDAYFECADEADVVCSPMGAPELEGCADPYGDAVDCTLGDADPEVQTACNAYCDSLVQADCDEPVNVASCQLLCRLSYADLLGCADEYDAFIGCTEGRDASCSQQGQAGYPLCFLQQVGHQLCVATAIGVPME